MLGAKKSYIYHLVHQGRIRSARSGRGLAFKPEWVDEFLDREAAHREELRVARAARRTRVGQAVPSQRAVRHREPVAGAGAVSVLRRASW